MDERSNSRVKSMLECDFTPNQYSEIVLTDQEQRDVLEKTIRHRARLMNLPPATVTLTSSEMDEALRLARRARAGELAEREYFKRLTVPRTFPTLTSEQMMERFMQRANDHLKKVTGRTDATYIVNEHNREVLTNLCQYFAGDPAFERGVMRLNKGIMLIGPVGCGKTMMMKMFSSNPKNSFAVEGCQSVSYQFAKDGFDVILRHSVPRPCSENMWGQTELATLYDDLGADEKRKHFGDSTNAMNEIIESRYRMERHYMTHITTNLDGAGVEEFYGLRTRSRCREMFNIFLFSSASPDLRK